MKKIFALALAAVMTAGMTTVAFADKGDVTFIAGDTLVYAVIDTNDDGAFHTDDDTYKFSAEGTLSLGDVEGGKKVALPLYHEGAPIVEKDDVKGWKVKAEWKVGDLDEKPAIEFVKVNGTYQYAVVFTMPENNGTKAIDLAGSITIYDKSGDLKDATLKVNKVEIGSEYGDQELAFSDVDDFKDAAIVSFKGEEGEETLTFGDYFEFTVDVTGQSKLNLKNNQDFNKEFAAMYDYANIDFITFENEPRFNKNGVAYIYADEDAFIYEVTADGAKAIKGLEWDEDYEAWTFKTRTLGAYAISDVELDEKTVTETEDSSKTETETGKPNPDTGR